MMFDTFFRSRTQSTKPSKVFKFQWIYMFFTNPKTNFLDNLYHICRYVFSNVFWWLLAPILHWFWKPFRLDFMSLSRSNLEWDFGCNSDRFWIPKHPHSRHLWCPFGDICLTFSGNAVLFKFATLFGTLSYSFDSILTIVRILLVPFWLNVGLWTHFPVRFVYFLRRGRSNWPIKGIRFDKTN